MCPVERTEVWSAQIRFHEVLNRHIDKVNVNNS